MTEPVPVVSAVEPGLWFRVRLPDGRTGGGQVIGVSPQAVAVCLSAGLWTCDVGRLDLESEPIAVEHLALAPRRLAEAAFIEVTPVAPERLALHAEWCADGGGPVVDAPLVALLLALVALGA
jgi:hypothetical protein